MKKLTKLNYHTGVYKKQEGQNTMDDICCKQQPKDNDYILQG